MTTDNKKRKVPVPVPVSVDYTDAKVVGFRDVTDKDYIRPNLSRDGGSFMILELNTGKRHEVFCPFLN